MSHFYGTLRGSRGEATRCGTKKSGLVTYAASWSGAIRTHIWHDAQLGQDKYEVWLAPWKGAGDSKLLARGVVGDASIIEFPIMSNGGNYFLTNKVMREVHAKG